MQQPRPARMVRLKHNANAHRLVPASTCGRGATRVCASSLEINAQQQRVASLPMYSTACSSARSDTLYIVLSLTWRINAETYGPNPCTCPTRQYCRIDTFAFVPIGETINGFAIIVHGVFLRPTHTTTQSFGVPQECPPAGRREVRRRS